MRVCLGSQDCCHCGCSGFCTMYPCLQVLAWDLNQAARGEFAALGPFGEELDPLVHHQLLARREKGMQTILAIIDITGDWPAWCDVAGLRYWAHHTCPCPACDIKLKDMHLVNTINAITTEGGPWITYTHAEYLRDVSRHKIVSSFVHQASLRLYIELEHTII